MARTKILKPTQPNSAQKMFAWMYSHWQDMAVIIVLLVLAGGVAAINFMGYPMRFEDEGTYVSQAWAVQYRGELTHYTYWYDHPPLAWLQIALYTTVTFAFERYESAVSAGREFMLVLHLLSVALVYAIARRLAMGKILAFVAAGLFAFSPLAVEFSRYVLLDNIALPWLLGAFLLALSPRKHLATVAGSAVCMAVAILSKETFLIFLPALLYVLYQHSDYRNRRYAFTIFGVLLSVLVAFYTLFAAIKGELLPGEGHVSLLGTLSWQLFGREGSGSILDPSSDARGLLGFWLNIDPWLIGIGAVLTPLMFIRRHHRPFAVAMLIGIAMMLRSGYLPYPHIIALLPFAALAIAGVFSTFIVRPMLNTRKDFWSVAKRQSAEVSSILVVLAFIYVIVPPWQAGLVNAAQVDADRSSRQAVTWVVQNIPRESRVVVESALWADLQTKGFNQPDPVWLYKTETDPEVADKIAGWRGIDYLVLNGPTLNEGFRSEFPTVFEAKDNGEVVAEFGSDQQKVMIIKVNNSSASITPNSVTAPDGYRGNYIKSR